MARLWRVIDGEPWMVNPGRRIKNPRLGILGLLNPGYGKKFDFHGSFKRKSEAIKRERQIPGSFILDRGGQHMVVTRKKNSGGKRMATKAQRHMAWVRSFQKNRRRRRHHHTMMNRRRRRNYRRRHNPYPMAGTVTALAGNPRRRHHHRRHHYMINRRRRRRNPGRMSRIASTSYFGIPSLQTIGWSVVGFSGTAALNGFVSGLVPTSWQTNADGSPSKIAKYGALAVSVAGLHTLVRMFRPAQAQVATIGAGLYAASVIIHDFLPGTLPGLQAYTPLHAYTPLRAYHRWGMPQLASQNIGATNLPVGWAPNGAMDILPQRLRRFN